MIRVAITSDVRIFREGIAGIFNQHPDIEVVGTATNAAASVDLADVAQPDVHVVDCATSDGLVALRGFAKRAPQVRTVAVGIAEQERDVVGCAEAGVAGYVTRNDPADRLLDVVRGVMDGETLCSPRMTAALLRRLAMLAANRETELPEATLTARERQILRLIDEGLSNKQISEALQIELPTVKNHVHRILGKLGVERRSQAAARFRRWQLVGVADASFNADMSRS
ncbi:MAG: response regulator transcription factor [Solirubrobacterales bacterium]|nr:response regulator transcription factor [Solirubrobacterales bacterium]